LKKIVLWIYYIEPLFIQFVKLAATNFYSSLKVTTSGDKLKKYLKNMRNRKLFGKSRWLLPGIIFFAI
jgi:hypothetical protein